jgi:hypothetical protein
MADDAETPEQKFARDKAYWENQKTVCEKLTPVDESLKGIKDYIAESQGSDPMYALASIEPTCMWPRRLLRVAPRGSRTRGSLLPTLGGRSWWGNLVRALTTAPSLDQTQAAEWCQHGVRCQEGRWRLLCNVIFGSVDSRGQGGAGSTTWPRRPHGQGDSTELDLVWANSGHQTCFTMATCIVTSLRPSPTASLRVRVC